jgi:uncharacterized membrane protein
MPKESPTVFCWTRRVNSSRSMPLKPWKPRSSTSTIAARSSAATPISKERSPTFYWTAASSPQSSFPVPRLPCRSTSTTAAKLWGGYIDAGGGAHGFLLDKRTFTTIDVDIPGAVGTQVQGINNRGQMTGAYHDAEANVRGFLMDKGVFTTVLPPDAFTGTASDINDRGQIVGFFRVPGDIQ